MTAGEKGIASPVEFFDLVTAGDMEAVRLAYCAVYAACMKMQARIKDLELVERDLAASQAREVGLREAAQGLVSDFTDQSVSGTLRRITQAERHQRQAALLAALALPAPDLGEKP